VDRLLARAHASEAEVRASSNELIISGKLTKRDCASPASALG
jgi:hypothetical protein